MINPKLKIGDRVVCLSMDDPDPINFGEMGEVVGLTQNFGYNSYSVKWDNGRRLDLLEDADKWMKVEDFEDIKKRKKKIKEGYTLKKSDLLLKLNKTL